MSYLGPELVLCVTALLIIVVDLFRPPHRRMVSITLGLLGILAAMGWTYILTGAPAKTVFHQAAVVDSFSIFFKYIALLVVAVIFIFAMSSKEMDDEGGAEFSAFNVTMALGMCLMASANDLIMMYISMELVSVLGYILAAFKKGDRKSSEAGLKYIIYGAAASGIMLYGMSLLYGLCGDTSLIAIKQAIAGGTVPATTLLIAVLFIFAGLGYKIAAVPFHMWCPDVYEGAPTPVTALLSVGPKAAGFAMLARFFYFIFSTPSNGVGAANPVPWTILLGVIAAATMTLGNLSAIPQRNLKRLLAFSSIAHAGYILMGLVAANSLGLTSVMFYLFVYMFMNLGAFLVVMAISNQLGSADIDSYKGLVYRAPYLAVVFAIFLFSLTGLPPFAGFIGKFYIFAAIFKQASTGYVILAIFGILNTVFALFYYTRVVKAMFLTKPDDPSPVRASSLVNSLLAILVLPIIVLGIYWKPLYEFASNSLGGVFG